MVVTNVIPITISKRRMRELNEIAGIAGRGMDEYENSCPFPAAAIIH